jgi:hypothetical protein
MSLDISADAVSTLLSHSDIFINILVSSKMLMFIWTKTHFNSLIAKKDFSNFSTMRSCSASGGRGNINAWRAFEDNPWIPMPFPPINPADL